MSDWKSARDAAVYELVGSFNKTPKNNEGWFADYQVEGLCKQSWDACRKHMLKEFDGLLDAYLAFMKSANAETIVQMNSAVEAFKRSVEDE